MPASVFTQPVATEIDLDRRLRRGDVLIVEVRDAVRDGEIVVVDGESGACVGRFATGADEIVLYPLEAAGLSRRTRCEALRVRGVVIGIRSAL